VEGRRRKATILLTQTHLTRFDATSEAIHELPGALFSASDHRFDLHGNVEEVSKKSILESLDVEFQRGGTENSQVLEGDSNSFSLDPSR